MKVKDEKIISRMRLQLDKGRGDIRCLSCVAGQKKGHLDVSACWTCSDVFSCSLDTPYEKVKFKQDVDMHSSSFDDAPVTIFSPGGSSPVAP